MSEPADTDAATPSRTTVHDAGITAGSLDGGGPDGRGVRPEPYRKKGHPPCCGRCR
ncbi:hypothetical protein ACWEKM_13950 [Streptomyces sp. NPDC004752]